MGEAIKARECASSREGIERSSRRLKVSMEVIINQRWERKVSSVLFSMNKLLYSHHQRKRVSLLHESSLGKQIENEKCLWPPQEDDANGSNERWWWCWETTTEMKRRRMKFLTRSHTLSVSRNHFKREWEHLFESTFLLLWQPFITLLCSFRFVVWHHEHLLQLHPSLSLFFRQNQEKSFRRKDNRGNYTSVRTNIFDKILQERGLVFFLSNACNEQRARYPFEMQSKEDKKRSALKLKWEQN